MMKLPLTQGAYEAQNRIANAQRCVNLYCERNPEDSPFPFTYYHTPGLAVVWNGVPEDSGGGGG